MDQGGGKRPGAFAIYIEPWHADVFDVLELKKNHGKDELRARYAQFVGSGSANFEQEGVGGTGDVVCYSWKRGETVAV